MTLKKVEQAHANELSYNIMPSAENWRSSLVI